jgi:hypothetical protein
VHEFGKGGEVGRAPSLRDQILVKNMNLATALKERAKIEFEMIACSLRNFAFCESAGLTTFAPSIATDLPRETSVAKGNHIIRQHTSAFGFK